MKKHIILILSFSITLYSCNNKNRKSQQLDSNEQTVELTSESETILLNPIVETEKETFDWKQAQLLKEELLTELQSPNNIDKVIMKFLNEYGKLQNELNDILFNSNNYDSLNTIAYAPNGIIYENALEFKNEVENNGFSISHSEGTIYISKNTEYIKSDIYELLDSNTIEFLNAYCNEIDTICCEDASIIISEEDIVERAFIWGNLMKKTHKTEFENISESEFYSYLSLIYIGQDNTPSFNWESKKFNQKYFNSMLSIIEKYPNSKAAEEFKEYTELLITENFEKTDKIDVFLEDKLK